MAAELRLGVSFDLVYFRTQLGKLSQIAASEFSGKVKLNIDQRDFQRQMVGLTKELRINVNDSQIVGARANLGQLNRSLATLRRAVAAPIEIKIKYTEQGKPPAGFGGTASRAVTGRLAGAQAVEDFKRGQLQGLYKTFEAAGMAVGKLSTKLTSATEKQLRDALIPAFSDSGEEAVNGLAIGLKDGSSKVAKAAANLAEDTLRATKDALGIASPSKEFKKVGEDSGEGLEQGFKIGFGEAGDVGVREIEKLFKRLQGEAQAGSAVLRAIIAGSMSGIVQLPGMGQRGARGSIGPMIRQQRAQVQAERQAQTGGLAAYMLGMMSGVIPMGGTPRGAGGSIRGLIEQERAKVHERNRPQRIAGIIEALSSARGNLSPAAGVNQRLFTGGAVNPGVLSSGYIGRSAISPKFLNYPAGMPPAYGTGFIEPTAFGSLAAGTVGRYGMGVRGGQFPSSPMMTGGFGAGAGSFVPVDAGRSASRFSQSLFGLIEKIKGTAGVVRSVLMPTFGDTRKQVIDMNRSIAVSQNAVNSMFYGKYMTPHGKLGMYDFPTSGMMGPALPRGSMGQFPMAGMHYPSSPLGVINAQSSKFGQHGPSGGWFGGFHNFGGGGGGGGGGGRGGGFSGGQFNNMMGFGPASPIDFSFFQQSKFPLTGAIRELGAEFGTAVKQVLLFGTAYKALAFVTNLPSEALNAATALQTFRNQLEAVTGGTAQAEQAFAFVSDVVSQLNIPLESARAGFIRMYASMEPAGIAKGDIENLFIGISKAAATFGMSTDEVNRVTNAFAQMASKGQLSAEEVKNQLGDVMPGALSLFARAAQMDIGTFLEAMEDGAFKAEAMGQVLRNVGKLLNTEYGGAAANAANTLQGALNGLTTAVKLMYESFEPLVSVVASTLFPQIETVVIDAAEAVKAFAAGMQGAANPTAELSSNGLAMYNALGQVVEIAKSLEGIITGELGTALVRLGGLFLTVTEYIARLFNTGLGQWLTRIAIEVGLVTAAWSLLGKSGIIPATVALLRFVATLNIAQLRVYIAGIMSMVAAFRSLITMTNLAKVAVIGFKTVVLGAVGAGVLFAIDALVQRFIKVGDTIRDVAAEARRAKADLDSLAASGQLAEIQGKKQLLEPQLQSIEKAQGILLRMQQARSQGQALPISQQEFQTLQRTGLASGIDYRGGVARAGRSQIEANLEAARRGQVSLLNQLGDLDEAEEEASRQAIKMNERNQRLEKVTLDPGKEKKGERKSLNQLVSRQILMLAEAEKAAIRLSLAETKGMAPDTAQAERILDFYTKFRNNIVDIQAIEAQIAAAEKNRGEWIKKYGMTGEEIDSNLVELRNQLKIATIDLATTEQEYRNRAKNDAAKEAAELEKKLEKQKELNRLLEDAAIEAGAIGPLEAARIQQRRGFESALDQARKDGTPEQVAQLQALQAATPVAGSLAEAYQKVREELEVLTDGTRVITTAAQGFGDAFSKAFTDIVTGAESWREGLGNAFRSVASMFADMVAQMLAKWAAMQIIGMLLPGAGSFAGGAKIGGSVAMPSSVGIGAGGGILQNAAGQGFGTFGPNFGIRQFATGGVVTGPTLGLVGEGRFNEAVVPLPNGKSIPVDLGQGAGNNISTNIVVNMNNGQSNSQVSGRGGQALGREIEGAVRNVILKETRPGGLIYSGR